jgi:hypothetical protein
LSEDNTNSHSKKRGTQVKPKRFLLTWFVISITFLILDMLFGILGAQITTAITGEPVIQLAGMESKFLLGILFEVINAFILMVIYAFVYQCLPGDGWLKGISYGLIIWGLRVLMWAFSSFIMFDISPVLLIVTAILGLFEVTTLGIILAVLYRPER